MQWDYGLRKEIEIAQSIVLDGQSPFTKYDILSTNNLNKKVKRVDLYFFDCPVTYVISRALSFYLIK